jgi:hypothetical protein
MPIQNLGNVATSDSPQKRANALFNVIRAVTKETDYDGGATPAQRLNASLFLLEVAWHEGARLTTRIQLPTGPGRSFYQFEMVRAREAVEYANQNDNSTTWLDDLAAAAGHTGAEILAAAQQLGGAWPAGNLVDQRLRNDDLFASILIRVALKKLPQAIPTSVAGHATYWADQWKRVFDDVDDRTEQVARFTSEITEVRALVSQAAVEILGVDELAGGDADEDSVEPPWLTRILPEPASPAAERDAAPADAGGEEIDFNDAVRIRIRRGEITISIRAGVLDDAAGRPPRVRLAEHTALRREVVELEGFAGAPPPPPVSPAITTPPRIGLLKVPADKFAGGYDNFSIRTDLRESYLAVYRRVHALGGIVTSDGAIRDLTATVTSGRSATSLHYTGSALDLFTSTGMQGNHDRYLVARDGGAADHPEWKVYCISVNPLTSDPSYDASLLHTGELEYAIWKHGVGYTTAKRTVDYFCLSDVFAELGWVNIPSRQLWKTDPMSVEWWHFQNQQGLVDNVTRFGDELEKVWPANLVAASGLKLDALWRGRSFQ